MVWDYRCPLGDGDRASELSCPADFLVEVYDKVKAYNPRLTTMVKGGPTSPH